MAKIALDSSLFKNAPPRSSILRSFTFLYKYRHIAVSAYVLAILTNSLAILIPQTIRWIVDAGIVKQDMQILLASLLGLLLLSFDQGSY